MNGGATTIYVYDIEGKLIAEYSTSLKSAPPCSVCYFSYDHLGSMRLVTNQSGAVVSRHDYLPFGEELFSGSAGRSSQFGVFDAVTQRFTGKEADAESGLQYFGARYYGSALGRFTSADPLPWLGWQQGNKDAQQRFAAFISNPQNLNLYAYVGGNPLSRTDPTGMYACQGTQDQCQKFKDALAVVQKADQNLKASSPERKRLDAVLKFVGKDDGRGPQVKFADLSADQAVGETVTQHGQTTLTFDPNALSHMCQTGQHILYHIHDPQFFRVVEPTHEWLVLAEPAQK